MFPLGHGIYGLRECHPQNVSDLLVHDDTSFRAEIATRPHAPQNGTRHFHHSSHSSFSAWTLPTHKTRLIMGCSPAKPARSTHIFSVCCPGVLFGEMVVDFGQIVQEPLICVLFGPPQHTHSPKNCHRAAHMQLRRREGARRNYGRKIMSLLKKRVGRPNLMCKIAHSCGSPVARGGKAFPGGGTPKPRMVHT